MTVGELKRLLEEAPQDLLVGVPDQDDVPCAVQTACVVTDELTWQQYFLIRANGGVPVMSQWQPF